MVFTGEILISAGTIIFAKSVYHHSCRSQAQNAANLLKLYVFR